MSVATFDLDVDVIPMSDPGLAVRGNGDLPRAASGNTPCSTITDAVGINRCHTCC